ncbi:MAG: hypothetical protein IJ301_05905 [Clostridia bacterium]|nr:hypothetical protein [Clostridia bacterium]
MKASFYSLECIGLGNSLSRLAQMYFEFDFSEQLYFEQLDDDFSTNEYFK